LVAAGRDPMPVKAPTMTWLPEGNLANATRSLGDRSGATAPTDPTAAAPGG